MNWVVVLFLRPLAGVAAAWLILKIFRIQHPASQHAVWNGALAGMVVILPLSFVTPRLNLALLPAKPMPNLHVMQPVQPSASDPCSTIKPAAIAVIHRLSTPVHPNRIESWKMLALLGYLAGALAVAVRQLTGWFLFLRLIRRSKPLKAHLRESSDVIVPVTGGFFSPVVLLPANWRQWSLYKRRSVLKHEFAHIHRGDIQSATLAGCVRCILWFHPITWWVTRKVATLAEMACDACVVESCVDPGGYCRLLLEFTKEVAESGHRTVIGLAMAERGNLSRRIECVFEISRGGLRRLTKPSLVLALGMAPVLCAAAVLDFSESAKPAWLLAPTRILMSLQGEHVGKLTPELLPSETMHAEEFLPASPTERAAISTHISAEDRVFARNTVITHDRKMNVVLIEPAQGDPYIFADVNLNGIFDAKERFLFAISPKRVLLKYPEVILKVQLQVGRYSFYPIRILLPEARIYKMNSARKGSRLLLRSQAAFVHGTFEIGGEAISATYQFDPDRGAAYPDFGWLGMDCNGDGWIDESDNQEEYTYAKDESVLFRFKGHTLSTVLLDLKSGTFIVREHTAGDNKRISLRVGDVVTDFSFVDLNGKRHRFSEFHGTYVLLDFWGTWCAPCRNELPEMERVYQQFRARSFSVLGMNDDLEAEKVRKVLSDTGVTYPQSSGEIGNALVYKQFRIGRFPTKVLVNPEGKIVALDDLNGSLDRQHLASTLDKALPSAK